MNDLVYITGTLARAEMKTGGENYSATLTLLYCILK